MRKFLKIVYILFFMIIILIIGIISYWIFKPSYSAEDFGIRTIRSDTDKDEDGIDDYTDILLGAKAEAERKPEYRSAYYGGRISARNRRSMYRCYMESIKRCRIFIKGNGR